MWTVKSDPRVQVDARAVALPNPVETECGLHYDLSAEGSLKGDRFVVRRVEPVPSLHLRGAGRPGQLALLADGISTLVDCSPPDPCCNSIGSLGSADANCEDPCTRPGPFWRLSAVVLRILSIAARSSALEGARRVFECLCYSHCVIRGGCGTSRIGSRGGCSPGRCCVDGRVASIGATETRSHRTAVGSSREADEASLCSDHQAAVGCGERRGTDEVATCSAGEAPFSWTGCAARRGIHAAAYCSDRAADSCTACGARRGIHGAAGCSDDEAAVSCSGSGECGALVTLRSACRGARGVRA